MQRDAEKTPQEARIQPSSSSHTHHHQQTEKGKNPEVDEEGFQQVKSRKNIRRNIFENKTQLLRANVANPRQEVAANTTTAAAPAATLNRHTRETLDPMANGYLEESLNRSWGCRRAVDGSTDT